ncbi:hypothetical protein CCACVL1_28287 [Corchorus capsularis]|uniref:Uncharacterized protein n=1 Tax=Corchorus capsularis TaxID=210143 RepID=A0A1R3G6Y6_COCAP|nr:hypothetical protein CCACVL1_28287 [Corchorus capsularis]
MNRFHQFQLCFLVIILLLFTPARIQAIRIRNLESVATSAKSPRNPTETTSQVFHPGSSKAPFTGQAGQFEEKRRVPTGSNPLHNRR